MKKFLSFLLFIVTTFSTYILANENLLHLPNSPHMKPFIWLAEYRWDSLRHKGEKNIDQIRSATTSLIIKKANLKNFEKTLKKIEKVESATSSPKELIKKEKFSREVQGILNRHYLLKKESAIFNIPHFLVSEENQQLMPSSDPVPQKSLQSLKTPVTNCTFIKQQEDSSPADFTITEKCIDKLSADFKAADTTFVSTYDEISLKKSIRNNSSNTTILPFVKLLCFPSFSALNQVPLVPYSSILPLNDTNILNNIVHFLFNHVKHRFARITVISALIYLKNVYQFYKKTLKQKDSFVKKCCKKHG